MATTTKTRNDYGRWRRALARAIDNNVTVVRVADDRYCVSSASKPGTGYLTNGYECSCQAALSGDPICLHRAAAWHAMGRLRTDAELIAAAEDTARAVLANLHGTDADSIARWQAAMDQFDAACREIDRAGVNWDFAAWFEAEMQAPGNVPAHTLTATDPTCAACHIDRWTWRAPVSGLHLCGGCLARAESFAGYPGWEEADKAARWDALIDAGAMTALAAD